MIRLALLFVTASLAAPAPTNDPTRQFDFWVGEWNVNNRFLQQDGSWKDGGRARARITPVLDGAAILEEWSGHLGEKEQLGFSLRAYDAKSETWKLLLNWPSSGRASFGELQGSFRHGRGEFFFDSQAQDGTQVLNRYSFSDGLPNSVRWDSATSRDGGQAWRTDWIMEFSRTRAQAETTAARLFETPFEEGQASPFSEARLLDFLIGDWEGAQLEHGASGAETERPLSYRCRSLAKGCLLLERIEIGSAESESRDQSLNLRAWNATTRVWDSRLHRKGSGTFVASAQRIVNGGLEDEELRLTWSIDSGESGGSAHLVWTSKSENRIVREWFLEPR